VEHVFAGGRAKVYIPRQNCEVMFALSAVRCPAVEKSAGVGFDGKPRPVRASCSPRRRAVHVVCLYTFRWHGLALVGAMSRGCFPLLGLCLQGVM
jgi:hypothetical protein